MSQKTFLAAFAFLAALFLLPCSPASAQQKGYYRSPAIFKNTIVFTAEGDLWKYDLPTGNTARLTTHAGVESNATFSPDGSYLVFTAEYEGSPEIYRMPVSGGVPKRLTYDFEGYGINISGFTPDGKILYRTGRYAQLPTPQLVKLDPQTTIAEPVPLWQASFGAYDAEGNLFFTRLPNQGSKTKRYKGGNIEQIWFFDGKNEASNLTADFDGTSTSPMVFNNRIIFLSDRDGTMNLWSMNKSGKDLKQLTFSKGWDLQTPYIYNDIVVYQKGADIWSLNLSNQKETLLDISLQSDFDQRKPRWIKSPLNSITEADLSPNGNYSSIISRGRLFVSPAKSDRWIEISRRSGIRFKAAHFINDRSMAVLSDESGEYELWKVNTDGTDSARQITRNSKTMITNYAVSPNEKYIAYTDKNDVLRIIDISNGNTLFRYDSAYSGLFDLGWSVDSRFLNFTQGLANLANQICMVDMRNKMIIPVTTARLDSYNPAWSADSNWLYFISDRNLHTKVGGPWGARQPEPFYTETGNIYALRLDTAAKFPFLQTDSWLSDSLFNPSPKKPEPPTGKKKKTPPPPPPAEIDWSLAAKALFQVPIKSGNISGLNIGDGWLYWLDRGALPEDGAKLFAFKIEESKKFEPVEIATNVSGYTLSGNRKKLLIFYNNRNISIADANGQKPDAEKSKLQLENWNFVINPQQDWKQMFADAWLMERDYFYDRDLHKVDWLAIRKQYEPLVDRITDRYELDDLLAQMVGELSALHTFVYGGDKRQSPDRIPMGFLGAQLKKTKAGLLIEHIYQSDPDYPEFAAPLNKPQLRIKTGDIITGVNNVSLSAANDIAELLANKVHQPVKLNLLDKTGKPYEQLVYPCSAYEDNNLRYDEWELTNRWKVDTASNNDIGYLHLKAMGGQNMDEFVEQFYPVFNRKGLIIDVRHNFGGNIDSWVLEKLMRKAWMYWQGRTGGPTWNMQYAFRGHMVILVDQVTSSDGEAVAEGFRRLGLGKVIGMRTWGGEIWLSSSNRLVDNGIATAAEFGVYGPEGKWLIEGRGVEPDFTIDNLPFETYKGKDAQLEFAIDYLQKKIKAEPVDIPKAPPHPDKSFKY